MCQSFPKSNANNILQEDRIKFLTTINNEAKVARHAVRWMALSGWKEIDRGWMLLYSVKTIEEEEEAISYG
jgi:hypothetical protein